MRVAHGLDHILHLEDGREQVGELGRELIPGHVANVVAFHLISWRFNLFSDHLERRVGLRLNLFHRRRCGLVGYAVDHGIGIFGRAIALERDPLRRRVLLGLNELHAQRRGLLGV